MRSRKRFTKKAMLKRFGDLAVAVADIPYKASLCHNATRTIAGRARTGPRLPQRCESERVWLGVLLSRPRALSPLRGRVQHGAVDVHDDQRRGAGATGRG